MSDGTCKKIDYGILTRLADIVDLRKKALDAVQTKYNTEYNPNCTSCHGNPQFFALRPKLFIAHHQYMTAVKMFLGALDRFFAELMKEEADEELTPAEMASRPAEEQAVMGPEFVPGRKKLRAHCEPWTKNASAGDPSRNLCGVVCRMQPSCVGFALDPDTKWCLWFDDAKQDKEDKCTIATETEYVKKRQGPQNEKLWVMVDKVHIFEKGLTEALTEGEKQAALANERWNALKNPKKAEDTPDLQEDLLGQMRNYSSVVGDAFQIRKQLLILREQAFDILAKEAKKRPPFPMTKEEELKELAKQEEIAKQKELARLKETMIRRIPGAIGRPSEDLAVERFSK
jgi:hypothetical protein